MFISRYCPTLIIVGIFLNLPRAVISDEEVNESRNVTTMDRLRLQLFTNYDKAAHPMVTRTQRTNVTIGLRIQFIDIDDLEGKMTFHGWPNLRWKDGQRTWTPQDFENITVMHIRTRDVWKPDLKLLNSAGRDGDFVGDAQITLSNEGSYLWLPPVMYTTHCNLNLKMWPYDIQTCKLKVGTGTMTTIEPIPADIDEADDSEKSSRFLQWELINCDIGYRSERFYNYIEYTFTLRRSSSLYSAVIFTPASCIILLGLSIFWLPPQMGEKILLNAVGIVIVAAFIMYFAQMLPILVQKTPLIVLFYIASLVLLSLSTITSIVVLFLSTTKHKQRVPEFFTEKLNGTLGKVLLLSQVALESEPNSLLNNGTKELDDHAYENPDQEGTATDETVITSSVSASSRSVQLDWILLATAIDRVCFFLNCFIFIVLAIVYSV